jgi:dinuclear metal center YbgI/SA1388 family protein
LNGLQIENDGSISRIASSVDASLGAIEKAAAAGADFLLVHHGLFWSGAKWVAGLQGRRIRALIKAGVALYSAHLPLDCHPDVGNNVVLAQALGLRNPRPFGEAYAVQIGIAGDLDMERSKLLDRIRSTLGVTARLVPAGPQRVQRIGIVTGAGTGELRAAITAGLDTFLTGEGPHHSYLEAEELGLNLIYAGHYATETVGVKALAAHLGDRFGLPWSFVDHPTGM